MKAPCVSIVVASPNQPKAWAQEMQEDETLLTRAQTIGDCQDDAAA